MGLRDVEPMRAGTSHRVLPMHEAQLDHGAQALPMAVPSTWIEENEHNSLLLEMDSGL